MSLVYVTGGSGVGTPADRDDEWELAWHATAELSNARYGALIVDATPPPSKVVDNLLTALDLPT
ncbi:hypothetical protein [Kribbella sp. NBC_00889]|uniref:hypothetical protein n=1 Tax=Kribbella sp. NBC_00889 TaxID=2975974 RepID=UPI003867E3CC|nr:hypothetical protein OG817_24030 [Kribbella sp. NBC_00889]